MAKGAGGVRGGGGNPAAQKVLSVLADLQTQGYSKQPPFCVGRIEQRMENYSNTHGIDVANELYMCPHGDHSIAHAMRNEKLRDGIAVEPVDLAQFAKNRSNMDLYYDKTCKNFVYVDGRNKFIIHPNEQIKVRRKKVHKVNFITASKLDANESFKGSRFDKIK